METLKAPKRWLRATTVLAFGALLVVGCSDEETPTPTGPDLSSQSEVDQQTDGQEDGQSTSEEGSIEDLGPSFAMGGGADAIPPDVDLRAEGAEGGANGAWYQWFDPEGSEGTGVLNPFLSCQATPQEACINTSGEEIFDTKKVASGYTKDLPLNEVPRVSCPGDLTEPMCLEFVLDLNDRANEDPSPINLDMMVLYLHMMPGFTSEDFSGPTDPPPSGFDEIFDMDDGPDGNVQVLMDYALNSGSGAGDVRVYVPTTNAASALEECPYDPRTRLNNPPIEPCGIWLSLYAHFTESDAGFEEWATAVLPFVTVEKTVETSVTQRYGWELDKSVDDDSHSLLPTESGTSNYTIDVTRTGPTEIAWSVEGTITITNPGAVDAVVRDVEDVISNSSDIDANVTCPEGFPFTVGSNESVVCDYSHDFASDPGDGTLTNTATVTLEDPRNPGTDGGMFPSPPVDFDFTSPDNLTEENATATLADDFTPDALPSGDPDYGDEDYGTLNGSQTFNFAVTFECDEDEGQYDNTATLDPVDGPPITDSESVTVSCAALEVTKTAETSLTRTWNWTIDKSVTPDQWDLFTGDDGTSEYTVSVDKVDSTDSDWAVSGTITVENVGSFAVNLSNVTDEVNGSLAATVDCTVDADFQAAGGSFPYDLGAGETLDCDYSQSLPNGDPGTNVATAHIVDNGTFSSDPVNFDFTDPVVTEVNDEINVTDTNGESWGPVSDDMSWTYTRTFTCDADEGPHNNTAEITETGQTANASVTVNCYDLTVTKDANTSLTRTWDWTIEKDIDESVFLEGTFDGATNTATIMEGNSLLVEWDVTLDATSDDSEWAVDGTITIANNHTSRAASLTGVSDQITPGGISVSVDCSGVTSVPAGGSIQCTYSHTFASDPGAGTLTNTATATLQNQSFDKDENGTDSGTTDFSGDDMFDFSTPDVTEVDECVDLDDVLEQSGLEVGSATLGTGTYCADQPLPVTFDVQFTFGGAEGIPLVCGDNMFDNTASFVTNDTQTPGSATSSINIFVECVEGCTLTQGYWKTHNDSFKEERNGNGPPSDETWDELPSAEQTLFYISGDTWFGVFWTPPRGNVYYNLAHQYMAAYLNTLAGASVPQEVQDAIAFAEDFFENNSPDDAKSLRGNNPDRKEAIYWAGILADYNEGEIGPGHCTENEENTF